MSDNRELTMVTVADMCRLTGVHRSTMYDWRKDRPKLYAAIVNAVHADKAYQDAAKYHKVKALIGTMDR